MTYGSGFAYAEVDGPVASVGVSYTEAVTLTPSSLTLGDYIIYWTVQLASSTIGGDLAIRVQSDAGTILEAFEIRHNSSDLNEAVLYGGFIFQDQISGTPQLDLDFKVDSGSAQATNARLMIFRVDGGAAANPFGTEYHYAERSLISSAATSAIPALRIDAPDLPAGDYVLIYSGTFSGNNDDHQVRIDDTTNVMFTTDSPSNIATDISGLGFTKQTFSAGDHFATIETNGGVQSRVRMEMFRIS